MIYNGTSSELGLYLSTIPQHNLLRFFYSRQAPYFRIELPASVDKLHKRISSKFYYNRRRSLKLLEQSHAPVIFEEHQGSDITPDMFDDFARMKQITHSGRYITEGRGYFDDRRLISNVCIKEHNNAHKVMYNSRQIINFQDYGGINFP